MNKLKTTNNGGMPFELDDIRWEQEAVRDGFKGILDTFMPGNASGYILNGCAVTTQQASYLIGAGYIYHNGEIFKVDEHEVAFGTQGCKYVFAIDISYDPTGEEEFNDNNVYDTYEIRKAKVIVNTDNPFVETNFVQMGSTLWFAAMYDAILTLIQAIETGWYVIDQPGAPAYVNGFSNFNGEPVAFKKDSWGNVLMRGITLNANPALAIAFTLPTGFKPAQKMSMAYDVGGTAMQIIINTNGEVQCSGGSGNFNFVNFKTL